MGRRPSKRPRRLQKAARSFLTMAYDGLRGRNLARMAIALRTPDYGELLPQMLKKLDASKSWKSALSRLGTPRLQRHSAIAIGRWDRVSAASHPDLLGARAAPVKDEAEKDRSKSAADQLQFKSQLVRRIAGRHKRNENADEDDEETEAARRSRRRASPPGTSTACGFSLRSLR